jgi:hypothetical protein
MLLMALLCGITSCSFKEYKAVSYYVVGEQDQWQLFMGINVYNDIVPKKNEKAKKVIIIYTTAGNGSCSGAHLQFPEYFFSHDAGKNSTAEFCADQTSWHGDAKGKRDTILGHDILKYVYKNVVSYCLRLPGGCMDEGFNRQSLQGLHRGDIPSLYAIDSTTKYRSWNDLQKTIDQIVANENKGITETIFNVADTDATINPGDHPDNIYSAFLGLGTIPAGHPGKINLFREYVTAGLPVNLSNSEIATEAALFSQVDYWLTNFGYPSEFTPLKVSCTARNYFRTITPKQIPR